MKAEGYDVSPETQEACLGILEGRFVADTEVAKSIARFKKDKDHG